jgi:signal transduction histidine kinase
VKTKDADEEELLRSAALQTANSIRAARQRAEEELVRAKKALEARTVELERALLDLKTEVEITQVLVDAHTIDEVANRILEILCRNLSWTCAQLWRVDRQAGVLRRSAGWCDSTMPDGDFDALASFDTLQRGVGLPGMVWQSREPMWIEKVEEATNFPRTSLVRGIGLRSVFGFPLIVSGEVSAIIELFSSESRPVDDSTLHMAATLGSHIGQFIERASAEADQRKALKELRRLQDVTQTALANLPLKPLFENLMSKICETVGSDMAVVLLLDEKANELHVGAASGPNVDSVQRFRLRVGESLGGRVALERSFIQARDATRDPSIRPELRALGFQTILGIPLLARTRLIGVLEVGSLSDREFTTDEIDFLHLVGQQVAIAIENSSLYEEAREANRIKDRFLSIASHELRTPLTSILGWTEMLKRVDSDDIRAEAMRAIEHGARTLAELIGDMLDASRIREGKLVLRPESIDLTSIVAAALKTVTPSANERGVKLQAEILANTPPIQADPGRIRQVVWNLLTNAIKFTPSGKTVTTRVDVDHTGATITVQDEGEGISHDFLPHIFDELQQEEKGTRAGGLGLGLHIVKTIVDMHGGTVEAHSEGEGRGATFIVRLPVSLPKDGESQITPPATPDPETPSASVP